MWCSMCSVSFDKSKLIFTLHEHKCDELHGYCLVCITELSTTMECPMCNKYYYTKCPIDLAVPIVPVRGRKLPILRPGCSVDEYNYICGDEVRLNTKICDLISTIDTNPSDSTDKHEDLIRYQNALAYIKGDRVELAIKIACMKYSSKPVEWMTTARLTEEYVCLQYSDDDDSQTKEIQKKYAGILDLQESIKYAVGLKFKRQLLDMLDIRELVDHVERIRNLYHDDDEPYNHLDELFHHAEVVMNRLNKYVQLLDIQELIDHADRDVIRSRKYLEMLNIRDSIDHVDKAKGSEKCAGMLDLQESIKYAVGLKFKRQLLDMLDIRELVDHVERITEMYDDDEDPRDRLDEIGYHAYQIKKRLNKYVKEFNIQEMIDHADRDVIRAEKYIEMLNIPVDQR